MLNFNGLTTYEQNTIESAITSGYTRGRIDNLVWELESLSDDTQTISQLISQGYTSGYCPAWELSFSRVKGGYNR